MLIILEGPDGVGKTTIAKRLARILNGRIIHCTKDTPNNFTYFSSIIRASENNVVIADRFCYGQFVYQNEDERNLTQEDLYELETLMLRYGSKVVYVKASPKTITSRLNKRGEVPLLTPEEMVATFDYVMSKVTLTVETWRTDQ